MFNRTTTRRMLHAILIAIGLTIALPGFARDSILQLSVTGFITKPPRWLDSANQEIWRVIFEFSGYSSTKLDTDIDSSSHQVKLVDVPSFANVRMRRPQNCSIGDRSIDNRHVLLVIDGYAFNQDQMIHFHNNTLRTLMLRFDRNGGYNAETGSVRCGMDGRLSFTY